MAEWIAEWWEANGKPLVHALFSFDKAEIRFALSNVPHAYYEYIRKIYERNPEHVIVETFLIVFIIYVTFIKKSYDPNQDSFKLTEKEVVDLCNEWEPEPLISVEPSPYEGVIDNRLIIESAVDTHVKVRGIKDPVLQFASFDMLGMGSRKDVKEKAEFNLKKYGCGACGPRGFYGSIDSHVDFESELAAFMGVSDCIVYSDGSTTLSSVIPAFAKRGDLVICDSGVNQSIRVGVGLARCQVVFYQHNDMTDLERRLKEIQLADKKAGRNSTCQRRYVVTEGLFRDVGDITDLPAVLALCKKYCIRLILDESLSFGVLGATGRGLTEHCNVAIKEIDILCGSLSTCLGSVGGFSIGTQEVVDYQRINSASYVFSASSPPFLSSIASCSLEILVKEKHLLQNIANNAAYLHDAFSKISHLAVYSHRCSPILHLGFNRSFDESQRFGVELLMEKVARQCLEKGVLVTPSRHLAKQVISHKPSFRVIVNALHTKQQINKLVEVLSKATEKLDFSFDESESS